MSDYKENHESLDEFDEDKKLNPWLVLALVAGSLIVIILIAYFLISKSNQDAGGGPSKGQQIAEFDPSIIPTLGELNQVIEKAIGNTYGEDFWNTPVTGDGIEILPGTNITFDITDVTDATDLMAFTVMALQSNPYAVRESHPEILKLMAGKVDGTVREMPDGTLIDLAELREDYTDMKFFNNRDVPTQVRMEGYRNGQKFDAQVDLFYMYQGHYDTTEGN